MLSFDESGLSRSEWNAAIARGAVDQRHRNVVRLYGAKSTPGMYVIDGKGTLVYRGAIDNAQDGDPPGGEKLVNYVDAALADLAAGRPVAIPETPSYGCSVKYGS